MLHDTWILFRREVRSALRERTIVVNGILIPIFGYPLLLWALFSAFLFVEGLSEGFESRVALPDSAAAPSLAAALLARDDVGRAEAPDADSARSLLERGELDAVARFEPSTGLEGNVTVTVLYDRAEERSRRALSRIEAVVDSVRGARLGVAAVDLGMDTTTLSAFTVERRNVSTERETGRMLLAMLVPLFLTIMVALGCFFPAVDTTAGERERSTWETLWTTGPSRGSIVLAKYLFVATMGTIAGVLNVIAITVSLGGIMQPLLGDQAEQLSFSLPPVAIPMMLGGAVLLALLFAAVMMVLAVFARTFKDGQAMVTPVYWLALAPMILGSSPDRVLTPAIALVPVANVAMAARDAIQGRVAPGLVILAFGVNILLVLLCLLLAKRLLESEEVVTGEFEGGLWSWFRSLRSSTS